MQIKSTSYSMAIEICTISITIYEIFVKEKKTKSVTSKMKVTMEEVKNGTSAIRLEMFESISVIFQNCIKHVMSNTNMQKIAQAFS